MSRLHRVTFLAGAAICLLAVACSSGDPSPGAATATGPNPADTTIVGVEGTPPPAPGESDPPTVTIAFGDGGAAPMRVGTYCWSGVCADAIGIITPLSPVRAAAGDEIAFAGEAFEESPSSVSLQLWALPDATVAEGGDWRAWSPETAATALMVTDGVAALPADLTPGRYLASLFATFSGGDAAYGVVIEIGP